jgi:tetratricopeptide (TPR) repeat protein
MKTKLLIVFILITSLSCNQNKEKQRKDDIQKFTLLEKEFYASSEKGEPNYDKGRALIDLYNDFVKKYPEDTLVPYIYYRAGSMYLKYLGDLNESIRCYEKLKKDYPKFESTPLAIYTLGYIFNDRKKNTEKAKEYYKYLIDTYPTHYLAEESKILYDNVGKSEEALWNYIQEKNKTTEDKQ